VVNYIAVTILFLIDDANDDCLTDGNGTDVLFNKFNANVSFPSDAQARHPNSDYRCAAATTDYWKVSRCDELHLTVCQSDYYIPTTPGRTSLQQMQVLLNLTIYLIPNTNIPILLRVTNIHMHCCYVTFVVICLLS